MLVLPKTTAKRIIPALLTHSKKDFLAHIEAIKSLAVPPPFIQLDVCDGKFVDNTTWGRPAQVKILDIPVPFEVHLMIQNPEKSYKYWIEAGAQRVVFHQEATTDPVGLARAIKEAGAKPIMAINPETKIPKEPLIFKHIYAILVMGVHPGFGGQKQLPGTLPKIRALRKRYPRLRIGVDGGVNIYNIQNLLDAGATELVMGSGFFT